MGAMLVRSLWAAAACAAIAAAPAIASGGGGGDGPKGPEIQSISYSQAESGATLIEAGVKRAKRVKVAVGQGEHRNRYALDRGTREAGVIFWSVEVPDREDRCAVVVLTAKNRHGFDDRRTRVCTFGESEPEDESPLPIP
ncbi:MAG TPA: hypothetical protein VFY99_00010 [Solirubrobacterales bacterium]